MYYITVKCSCHYLPQYRHLQPLSGKIYFFHSSCNNICTFDVATRVAHVLTVAVILKHSPCGFINCLLWPTNAVWNTLMISCITNSRPALGPTQSPTQWVPHLFTGGKTAGVWRCTPTTYSADVKERVKLYLYSPSGPSWPVIGWPLFYFITNSCIRNSCAIWQGVDCKLPEDDTIVSKHVGLW
jgi:hypothetical protein